MKKNVKILIGVFVLCLCVLGAGCGKEDTPKEAPAEPADTTLYCPLDHAEVSELSDRVFAVAIDNGAKSEPQTGLGSADMLFELPVEGGITRFLALYYHNHPDTIGPVRSARHYFIDLVQSFDGIYIHCGGSFIAKEELVNVDEIDEMGNSSYFWRDKSRTAPTNLYTSWEKIVAAADAKDMSKPKKTTEFSFYNKDEVKALPMGSTTEINIPYTYKSVAYQWNEENKNYSRLSKGAPHMDAADNTQLYADNVVVLANETSIIDANAGLLEMQFVNHKGSGMIFQNGTMVPITWSMGNSYSPLVLTLADGSEAKLLPGKTIVQVVPKDMQVSYNGGAESGKDTASTTE